MKMATDKRCIQCFKKTYDSLLEKFPLSNSQVSEFSSFFDVLMDESGNLTSPEIQRELHHKLRELNGIADPFLEEKQHSNRFALTLYNEWKPKVLVSADPFDLALRLAIAGNIMDYSANHRFDLNRTIEISLHADYGIDHSSLFKERIRSAGSILYLGDNTGEIVFDKLFIETISRPDVKYIVRSGPIINDVTVQDAEMVGMDRVARIVSSGYDSPSTVINKSSTEFKTLFASADLIISKGQGNFEGLMAENDPRIFFLLMVKCAVIADRLKVKEGSFVVFNPGEDR